MKKLLLLPFLFISIYGFEQQQTDSLLLELKKHPQEDTVRYLLLRKLSYQYSFTNPEKGIAAANAAIELAERLNSTTRLAGGYSNKATNLHKLGRDSEALNLYRIAINMQLSADNKKGAANAYFNIAYVYFDIGNFFMAINYELKALRLYKELGLVSDEADACNSIADSYMRLDDYPSALKYFNQALNIYQQLGLRENEAMVLSNIGMTYHALYDSSKAISFYDKALKIDEQIENKTNLAHDYQHIGVLYDDAGNTKSALAYYQKSFALNKAINDKREMAENYVNLATAYSKLKNYTAAYKSLNNALNIYNVLTDNYNVASLLNEKGKMYVDFPESFFIHQHIPLLNRYNDALNYQQQALQLATKTKSYTLTAQILQDISTTHEKNFAFEKALSTYKQAVALHDTIFNDDQKKQITKLEMQNEFDKKEAAAKALTDKQQTMATAEINRQKIIRNAFIVAGIIVVLAVITSFIFYKRRKDAEAKKNETEFNAEVTETEMKALRAQMNPHFIFNSLNSIADYIDKYQTQIASDFTVKFAKLMRMVLENSEHKTVTLDEDLKALELYMQLECLRLKNKFSYEINVDESIDKENTLVPPLLLQPFVENSIWHGIANKDEGIIKISVSKEGEMINCVVEDNGKGMQEKEINTAKNSFGIKITKARIDIINKLKNANASMRVFNKDKGVRAEIKLPLELSF